MSAIDIRPAAYDDGPLIAAVRRRWALERDADTADESFEGRFAAWFEREHDQRITWLAMTGDEPVGMLNLLVFTRMPWPAPPSRSISPRWGYLANFYVAPEHRDSGVGTRLLAECTAYADAHDFARIVLSPSERSVPLYGRHGFVPATSLMVREA